MSASYQGVALPPAQSITPNPSLSVLACIARLPRPRLLCILLYRTLRLVVPTEDRIPDPQPNGRNSSSLTPPITPRRHEVDQPLPVRPNTGGEGPRMAAEAEAARTDARPGGAQRGFGLTVDSDPVIPLIASLSSYPPSGFTSYLVVPSMTRSDLREMRRCDASERR
jgi:hypothetical protein